MPKCSLSLLSLLIALMALPMGRIKAQNSDPHDDYAQRQRWLKRFCHEDNIEACTSKRWRLKLKSSPTLFFALAQKEQIQDLCQDRNCLEIKAGELEKWQKEMTLKNKKQLLQKKSKKTSSLKWMFKIKGGKVVKDFIGANQDIPRPWLVGAGAGIIFCHGHCQLYLEAMGHRGSKDQIVQTKYKDLAFEVHFTWVPIHIAKRVMVGLGPSFNVTFGQLESSYQDALLKTDFLALSLGLDVMSEVNITKFSLTSRDDDSWQLSAGILARVFLQQMITACDSFKDDQGQFSRCYNYEQLRTLEAFPIAGGAFDSSLFLKIAH